MKYFVPELALGALLPPQSQFVEKFGGLPWGLPLDRWPLCAECGNPQTHLATLVHHAERLDLGKEGRAVLIFQCGRSPNETDCEAMQSDSGANAVIFLDADEISTGLTEPPAPGASREFEIRIVKWVERHDLVTPELEASFYSADGFWDQPDEVRQTVEDSIEGGARLGSVPCWVQEPEDVESSFHFAAQLAMYYHFPDPLPTADEVRATISVRTSMEGIPPGDPRRWDPDFVYTVSNPSNPDPNLRGQIYVSDLTIKRYGSGFDVEAAEFGDGGSGYLFVNPGPDAPQGLFMWQCG